MTNIMICRKNENEAIHSLSELKADYPRFARMHHKSSILS